MAKLIFHKTGITLFAQSTSRFWDTLLMKMPNATAIIERIIDVFSGWTAVQLSDFTHMLEAWRKPDLYAAIPMQAMMDDPFMAEEFGNGNFGAVLMAV